MFLHTCSNIFRMFSATFPKRICHIAKKTSSSFLLTASSTGCLVDPWKPLGRFGDCSPLDLPTPPILVFLHQIVTASKAKWYYWYCQSQNSFINLDYGGYCSPLTPNPVRQSLMTSTHIVGPLNNFWRGTHIVYPIPSNTILIMCRHFKTLTGLFTLCGH